MAKPQPKDRLKTLAPWAPVAVALIELARSLLS